MRLARVALGVAALAQRERIGEEVVVEGFSYSVLAVWAVW